MKTSLKIGLMNRVRRWSAGSGNKNGLKWGYFLLKILIKSMNRNTLMGS